MPNKFICGVDFVDINRVKNLIYNSTNVDLQGIFSHEELDYAGKSNNRYGRLAARFAAKEACLKLFPMETAIASLDLSDFSVKNDAYGAPHISLSPRASILLELHGFEQISISLSHTKDHAIAMVIATRKEIQLPLIRRLMLWLRPIRRKLINRFSSKPKCFRCLG
jgi:holo-[acyl-carrier protein] synthase